MISYFTSNDSIVTESKGKSWVMIFELLEKIGAFWYQCMVSKYTLFINVIIKHYIQLVFAFQIDHDIIMHLWALGI